MSKCPFDIERRCKALLCYSSEECDSRLENGQPNYEFFEKPQRLNAIISVHSGPYANLLEDAADMADAYEQALAALRAEIDRRDREAWTDEDMFDAACHGRGISGVNEYAFKAWLAARRAAKAKE
jgi:hypothetical protein